LAVTLLWGSGRLSDVRRQSRLTDVGYAAYEKLSPDFRKMRKIIDGKQAVYRSAHPYLDRNDPTAGPIRLVDLDQAESDLML
jgi:hypothetical protein